MDKSTSTPPMIPMGQCVRGRLYRLRSRNLALGVYDGAGGFVGVREKFDSRYLFTEYHWDTGPPFGTVRPLEDLGDCPIDDLREQLGLRCQCGLPCHYDDSEPYFDPALQREFRGRWRHLDADRSPMNFREDHAARPIRNRELFDWLDEQAAAYR